MNISWNAAGYAADFSFVHEYGSGVLDLIQSPEGSTVIDLGCGGGQLTQQLAERGFAAAGIDASPDMLARARQSYPALRFEQADARRFSLAALGMPQADCIFSNAVLHWIDDAEQPQLLANIAANVKEGGEFVAEFGGCGCAARVHDALCAAFARRGKDYLFEFYFPTVGQYAPLLEQAGLRVACAALFDRPTRQAAGLDGWIRMFDMKPFTAAGFSEPETAAIIREAEEELRPVLFNEAENAWYVDYVRLRFRAVRTGA